MVDFFDNIVIELPLTATLIRIKSHCNMPSSLERKFLDMLKITEVIDNYIGEITVSTDRISNIDIRHVVVDANERTQALGRSLAGASIVSYR